MHTAPGPRLTLSAQEAANVLGISVQLLYEQARRAELPTMRVGRRLRVPVRPLLSLVGVSWEEWVTAESSTPSA